MVTESTMQTIMFQLFLFRQHFILSDSAVFLQLKTVLKLKAMICELLIKLNFMILHYSKSRLKLTLMFHFCL